MPIGTEVSIQPETMTAEFQKWHQRWCSAFGGDALHRNSIDAQISQLVLDAGVFQVINESRGLADCDEKGHARLNRPLHDLLNRCFVHSQLLGVRRQLDAPEKSEKKDINSLYAVIVEMQKQRLLWSRANFFAARGLSLDYAAVKQEEEEAILREFARSGPNKAVYPECEMSAWDCKRSNEDFDRLSMTTAGQRTPNDLVDESVFLNLRARLDDLKELGIFVNKFIAHAATQGSIMAENASEIRICLEKLAKARETLVRVAQFVSGHMLRSRDMIPMPTTLWDVCEHFERPIARPEHISRLHAEWRAYEVDVNSWSHDVERWVLSSSPCSDGSPGAAGG